MTQCLGRRVFILIEFQHKQFSYLIKEIFLLMLILHKHSKNMFERFLPATTEPQILINCEFIVKNFAKMVENKIKQKKKNNEINLGNDNILKLNKKYV